MKTRLFLEKNNIEQYIKDNNMLQRGDGIVVGLSGGPDSVCLLFVLLALQKEYNLDIRALHVNHGIRGAEALRDQNFVEALCKSNNVPLVIKSYDVPELSKKMKMSEEEAGRVLRYEAFEMLANQMFEMGINTKIAIAHNADDNAETVVLNMIRGSGLDGMKGIVPVRGRIIRPLLGISKKTILDFLEESKIEYIVDSTNLHDDYARNRVRNHVLPELRNLNNQAVMHVFDMSQNVKKALDYLDEHVEKLLQSAKFEKNNCEYISCEVLREADDYIMSMALKKYISSYMPYQKDVSAKHIEAAKELVFSENGSKSINLPHSRKLCREYDSLYVKLIESDDADTLGLKNNIEDISTRFQTRIFDYDKELLYSQKTYTKWVDYDKIKNIVSYRYRQSGDMITIDDKGSTKKLKDYFINEKIPKDERDFVPLVCDGSHVIWAVGYRLGAAYKVDETTKRVLEIIYKE